MPSSRCAAIAALQLADHLARGLEGVVRHVALVAEIDGRLDQRAGPHQLAAPALVELRQRAAHLAQRLAPLCLGLGIDEIGKALDLRQIQLAVVKGAAGELAGLGETAPGLPPEHGQHAFDDGRAAVQVEFGHVLARLGARRGEPQHQRLVERLACLRIADAAQGGEALLGTRRRQRIDEIAGFGARDAHDRHAGPAGRARQSEDGGGISHASRLAVAVLKPHVSASPQHRP